LYEGPEAVVAVDRASVRRDQDFARYRLAVAPAGGGRYGRIPYAYQVVDWRVDCSEMTGLAMGERLYDKDAIEIDVRSLEIPPLNTGPISLQPGTPIHRYADAACNDHWGDEPALESGRAVYVRSQRMRPGES
jgi:hypothetical protein